MKEYINTKRLAWLKLGIILLFTAIYFFMEPVSIFIKRAIFILGMNNISVVKGYLLSFGASPMMSFLLMIFQSVLAPLSEISIVFANTALFGTVKGAILTWASSMTGALFCFCISKVYGRNLFKKFTSKLGLRKSDGIFQRHGMYIILVTRLVPFLPFDLVSYAAGLTSIDFRSFICGTGLGLLPSTIIYSYTGQMITDNVKILFTVLSIIFVVSLSIFLVKKK